MEQKEKVLLGVFKMDINVFSRDLNLNEYGEVELRKEGWATTVLLFNQSQDNDLQSLVLLDDDDYYYSLSKCNNTSSSSFYYYYFPLISCRERITLRIILANKLFL